MDKWQTIVKGAEKALPDILIGMGISFNALALIDGVRHTPKAMERIRVAEEEKGDKLTAKETIKATWKCYVPSAIELIVGDICIIGGSMTYHKRNAGLMALCSLSETALKQYQDKIVEVVGNEKAEEIANAITEDKLMEKHKNQNGIVLTDSDGCQRIMLPDGTVPCFDEWSGREFYARKVDIEHAINECNKMLIDYDEICVNDFYAQINLDAIDLGNDMGWSSDSLIEVVFGSHLIGDVPYLSIRFRTRPKLLKRMW